jgi:hypothetical protein
MFFIFMIFGGRWPNFQSRDLRSFSSILSVSLGARMSFIIYLQSWSEFMALAHLIWWISLVSPQNLGFSS